MNKPLALFTTIILALSHFAHVEGDTSEQNITGILGGESGEGFARAVEPMDLVFPKDHGQHPDYKTEWWYYTGNLKTDTGREFGYQLTFFRRSLAAKMPVRKSRLATNQIYMAHFAVTDIKAKTHTDTVAALADWLGLNDTVAALADWLGHGESRPTRCGLRIGQHLKTVRVFFVYKLSTTRLNRVSQSICTCEKHARLCCTGGRG